MLRFYVTLRVGVNNSCRRFMTSRPQEEPISDKQKLMKLRNKTGYPLINCRQALKATEYDMDKAEVHLIKIAREKGWSKMQDPTGKKAHQGLIAVAKSKTTAAIVEVNCNSDFVAKTAEFQRIVKDAAETTLKTFTEDTDKISLMGEEILRLKIPGKDDTLQEEVALAIGKLKENIVINRGCILNAPPGGFIASYIHPSVLVSATRPGFTLGSFAVIAAMSCHDVESSATAVRLRGRDLCQHIVGMKPVVIGEKRVEVLNETKVKENSPDVNSVSGTVEEHEVRKYPPPNDRSDHLMRQPFLLDTDISVEHWLEMAGLEIHDFIRYQVGENVK